MITLTQFLPPSVAVVLLAQYLFQDGSVWGKSLATLTLAAGAWLQFTSVPFSPRSLAGLLLQIVLAIALLLRQAGRQ